MLLLDNFLKILTDTYFTVRVKYCIYSVFYSAFIHVHKVAALRLLVNIPAILWLCLKHASEKSKTSGSDKRDTDSNTNEHN